MSKFLSTAILVAIAITVGRPALAAEAPPADCRLHRYGSADITGLPERVIVPASLDGGTRLLAVDTGALGGSIDDYAVSELKLGRDSIQPNFNVGDQVVTQMAVTREFIVGDMKLKRWEFLVRPHAKPETGPLPVVGWLGNDFLRNFDVEFDFANKKLSFFNPKHCPGNVVYWADTSGALPFREGKIKDLVVIVELDGKKIEASLHTGTATSSMRLDVATTLFGLTPNSPGVDPIPGGKTIDYRYRFNSLTAADVKISNPELVLYKTVGKQCAEFRTDKGGGVAGNSEAAQDCYSGPPLRLGMNFLSRLHLYLAYHDKMIYLTPAEAKR